MENKKRIIGVSISILVVIALIFALFIFAKRTQQQPISTPLVSTSLYSAQVESLLVTPLPIIKTIRSQDIPGVHPNYQFTANIPISWNVKAVEASDSIAFIDPNATGASGIDTSQIFVRYFSANQFLTLSTVKIFNRQSLLIGGRPAVRYDIEKNPSVPNFPNQPVWRNERHVVTDIRVSDSDPSVFYVIAKRPGLDEQIYEQFLQSIQFRTVHDPMSIVPPVEEFAQRITKKPFGIYITPEHSPVQPERFAGYHTGVDVEYGDISREVPVVAVADGTVVLSQRATGYGGVVAIQHTVADTQVVAVYGHLDPASIPKRGTTVTQGKSIGMLGDGGTPETDGERKHLHFGLHVGNEIDIRGYVQQYNELSSYLNPLEV